MASTSIFANSNYFIFYSASYIDSINSAYSFKFYGFFDKFVVYVYNVVNV